MWNLMSSTIIPIPIPWDNFLKTKTKQNWEISMLINPQSTNPGPVWELCCSNNAPGLVQDYIGLSFSVYCTEMGWSKYLKFSHIVHIDLSCFCNILAPHFQTEKKKKKKKIKTKNVLHWLQLISLGKFVFSRQLK